MNSSGWGTRSTEVHHFKSEDEDCLGYYPDGNKRTLTDDQIAMFRHSEIYAILRQNQIREENAEADGDEESAGGSVDSDKKTETAVPVEVEEVEHVTTDLDAEHGNVTEHHQAALKPSLTAKNKRKRNNADDGARPYTSRRLARELDSAVAEDCVLNYGEESVDEEASSHAHPQESYREEPETQNTSTQGRKIWWPVIPAA